MAAGSLPFPHSTIAEIDVGSTPVASASGTITDARCTTSSGVVATVAYSGTSDKDLDEMEMDSFELLVGQCANGSFSYFLSTTDRSYLAGTFPIRYTLINN